MEEVIRSQINKALSELGVEAPNVVLEHPGDTKNGDYSTNIALALSKQLVNPPAGGPRGFAEQIASKIEKTEDIEKVEVAGVGFINFFLSRDFFAKSMQSILNDGEKWGSGNVLSGKKIMVEYTDPNPFKPFHIGHLMSNAIGESISRLIESQGAEVVRANYQGDVGLHVAKAMYGMFKAGPPADESAPASVLAQYIGECYAKGSDAYEDNPEAKKEIETFNKKIYDRSDEQVNQVYDWGRKLTLDAFEDIYKLLGTKFEHYFFESEMAPIGEKIVRENIGNVFSESEGAIVFKADEHDSKLHTRVFVTSLGIPLYETKEIGLTVAKFEKEKNLDTSVVITANEQSAYFAVVTKAIQIMYPEIGAKMQHIAHGMMRFADSKMSSRKGNVVTGESLLKEAKGVVLEKMKDRNFDQGEMSEISDIVSVAALKYSILRQAIGGDIIYDFNQSISFEGDSGPYLQYSYVRAKRVLEKSKVESQKPNDGGQQTKNSDEIYAIEKMLYCFPEIIKRSAEEYAPHHIVVYLNELASEFNSFYANNQIIDATDEEVSGYRIQLTKAFAITMRNGLSILGIRVPEKM